MTFVNKNQKEKETFYFQPANFILCKCKLIQASFVVKKHLPKTLGNCNIKLKLVRFQ